LSDDAGSTDDTTRDEAARDDGTVLNGTGHDGTGHDGTGHDGAVPDQTVREKPSRRSFMVGGAAAVGLGAAVSQVVPGRASAAAQRLIEKAVSSQQAGASLGDIEHVVILMQENRSFDSYFGTLSGVRGFSDPDVPVQTVNGVSYPLFDQFGYQPGKGPDASGYMQPFHLMSDPPTKNGQDTNDISHTWMTQHQSWNNGALDSFMTAHLTADGDANGPVTMGYYDRGDLSFYYALADAFTVCDSYFCSVIGPTDPNRLMAMSASIDPDGTNGGPVVETFADRIAEYGKMTWETMPERLLAAGVSFKVYNDPLALLALSPLPYFKAYNDIFSSTGQELVNRALSPKYPGDFTKDVKSGKLPSVSWIIPPLAECEHPAAPPEYGEYFVYEVLSTLVSNPDVWAKTVVFVVYDENGGFFDHVPPPTAPAGTAGEYLTTLPSAAEGIAGPVGLGFRTPSLVLSPFSRGGYLYNGVLDHTSTLRFIETRFGVEVPNLTAWRRGVTGDFTGALNLRGTPDTSLPPLPTPSLGATGVWEQAVLNALTGTLDVGIPYPLPASNSMPSQAGSPVRPPVP
jgi:phospholipase C